MWPIVGRPNQLGFPHPKGEDDCNEEEEERLLDNVIESDDEQADTLTPDQIRKYIDENQRQGGRLDAYNGGGGARGSPELSGKEDTSSRGGLLHPPLVDEYDELFDEDFEVEPDNVVVGAKLRHVGADAHTGSSTGASIIGRDSLDDWLDDDDDDDSPHRAAVPLKAAPLAGQLVPVQALGVSSPSTSTSLSSFGQTSMRGGPASQAIDADWSEALDSAWRAPAFEGLVDEQGATQQGPLSDISTLQGRDAGHFQNGCASESFANAGGTVAEDSDDRLVADNAAMDSGDATLVSSFDPLQPTNNAVCIPAKLASAVEEVPLEGQRNGPQIFDIADDPDL